MAHIDWTTELKKIEREFSGLPPEPTAEQQRVRRAAEQRKNERQATQNATVGASIRLVVVAALATALNFWPYPRACGVGLFAFMGAQLLIVGGGVWTGIWTWRGRLPRLHLLALMFVLLGLAGIAAQVLPRIGYARADLTASRWVCAGS